MKWLAWFLVLTSIGCGGSKHGATDPAARARDAERKRIEAMKPASPYELRQVRGYRAPTACGQGPYRIDVAALGARFGEQLEINICAPRSLEGDYRLTRGTDKSEPRHFGSRNNSDHCRATASEAAQRGDAGTAGPPAAAGRAASGGAGSARALPSAAPIALAPITGETVGDTCPGGMYLTGIVDHTTEMDSGDGIPWKAGASLVLELWSAEPLHLDGAMFVVIQRGVRADMTVERWASYREAKERWRTAWNAYLDGEVVAGRAERVDMQARSDAPPPPRPDVKPPKPSLHAEWIAGYWIRDREWIWSPGFWRVPDADIVAERTIEAPVAPPPMKTEAPPPAAPAAPVAQPAATPAPTPPPPPTTTAPVAPPAPAVTVVWTPGYWSWNGTTYVWIDGAWRAPPQHGARWVPPSWTSRRGRYVLVPGGWSVRIRR